MPTGRYMDTDIMFDTSECVAAIANLANATTCSAEEIGEAFKTVSLGVQPGNNWGTMEYVNTTTSEILELKDRITYLEILVEEMKSTYKEENQFLRNINWGW